ncbi:MAG: hypothetical protein HWE26_13615 [Alteromonadaceae bacterium]|nr:hypothetical protein [Alteromonadaceae bacterium]
MTRQGRKQTITFYYIDRDGKEHSVIFEDDWIYQQCAEFNPQPTTTIVNFRAMIDGLIGMIEFPYLSRYWRAHNCLHTSGANGLVDELGAPAMQELLRRAGDHIGQTGMELAYSFAFQQH